MTVPNLSCDQFADRLADLLERELDEPRRVGMEAHASACAECGSLLAGLRRLRMDAANLPVRTPSTDLWAGIAARIETPVVRLEPHHGGTLERGNGRTGGTWRPAPVWYGLVAAGLVAVTAAVTHQVTKREMQRINVPQVAVIPAPVADSAAKPSAADTQQVRVPPFHRSTVPPAAARAVAPRTALVAEHRPSADQTYEEEIARLRIVLQRRRPDLDSSTIAVVDHNLHVIDDAIAQCKQALEKDPASRFLMESLNDAMDDKVQLLRTAVALPSRS